MAEQIELPTMLPLSILLAVIVGTISYQLWITAYTQPSPSYEGFSAPVRGTSELDCGQASNEATKLYAIFSGKVSTTEEGADDLRELKVMLGKICCLKRDMMAPATLVNATRRQPFSTAHDLEPVAETAARCFAKTIPKRDVELALEKWNKRADFLVRRLCTSYTLNDSEEVNAISLLDSFFADIKDVLMNTCLKGAVSIAGQAEPRMVHGVEPAGNGALSPYGGYY